MKHFIWILLFTAAFFLMNCGEQKQQTAGLEKNEMILVDADSNQYALVKIGEQIWMAENLRVTRTPAGRPLSGVYAFADDEKYVEDFGRLYTWDAAIAACPEGWHLPDRDDWQRLFNYLGGDSIAGGKLKCREHWEKPNVGAANTVGFNACGGGFRGPVGEYHGQYFDLKKHGDFWGKIDNHTPWSICIYHDCEDILKMSDNNRTIGFSVRYIKNRE